MHCKAFWEPKGLFVYMIFLSLAPYHYTLLLVSPNLAATIAIGCRGMHCKAFWETVMLFTIYTFLEHFFGCYSRQKSSRWASEFDYSLGSIQKIDSFFWHFALFSQGFIAHFFPFVHPKIGYEAALFRRPLSELDPLFNFN